MRLLFWYPTEELIHSLTVLLALYFLTCTYPEQWFGSANAPKDWRDRLANTAPATFSNGDVARESLTQF